MIKAHDLSYHSGSAVAYLLRAGNKPGADPIQDRVKAVTHLMQEIRDMREAAKGDCADAAS